MPTWHSCSILSYSIRPRQALSALSPSLSLFLACTTSHRRRYYKHFRTNYAPLDMQDTKRRLLNVHWKLVFVLASCSMPESFLFNLEVLRTHCVRTLCISTTRSSSNNAHCIFAEYCRHCSDRKTAKSTTLFAPMIFYRRFFLESFWSFPRVTNDILSFAANFVNFLFKKLI